MDEIRTSNLALQYKTKRITDIKSCFAEDLDAVPTLGDNVYIGPEAKIFGSNILQMELPLVRIW